MGHNLLFFLSFFSFFLDEVKCIEMEVLQKYCCAIYSLCNINCSVFNSGMRCFLLVCIFLSLSLHNILTLFIQGDNKILVSEKARDKLVSHTVFPYKQQHFSMLLFLYSDGRYGKRLDTYIPQHSIKHNHLSFVPKKKKTKENHFLKKIIRSTLVICVFLHLLLFLIHPAMNHFDCA